MDNKIQCRKCGGDHLTIKCGKESESHNNMDKMVNDVSRDNSGGKIKTFSSAREYNNTNKYTKQIYHSIYRVKLSDLPNDITFDEMTDLMNDWGHIVKIKLVPYGDTTSAYIDFGYKEEADYFISAIDKTPFDYRILSACVVETTTK